MMETANSRCRSCEDRERCCHDSNRWIGRVNLCLVVGAFIYVAVLHREVVGLRTQLERCTGGVGATPCSQTGNGHDVVVRVEETDEVEEEEVFYGHGPGHPRPEKETPVEVVTLDPQRQRLRRAATGQEGMKKVAKKNKKRHRKRGIKGLHMEGDVPGAGNIKGKYVWQLDHGKLTPNGYSPPTGDLKFRYWNAPAWTRLFSSMFRYNNDTGETLVKEPGLYYIYSQITLSTNALRSGYSIYIDGKAHFTCVCHRSVNSSNEMLQNTCTASGLVVLSRRQKISLGVESEDLQALMKPRLSYWGMIKLAGFRYVVE